MKGHNNDWCWLVTGVEFAMLICSAWVLSAVVSTAEVWQSNWNHCVIEQIKPTDIWRESFDWRSARVHWGDRTRHAWLAHMCKLKEIVDNYRPFVTEGWMCLILDQGRCESNTKSEPHKIWPCQGRAAARRSYISTSAVVSSFRLIYRLCVMWSTADQWAE